MAHMQAARPGLPFILGSAMVPRLLSSISLMSHRLPIVAPQTCHTYHVPSVLRCCWASTCVLACPQVTVVDASTFDATMAGSATLQDLGQAASTQDRRSLAGLLTDQVWAAGASTAGATLSSDAP